MTPFPFSNPFGQGSSGGSLFGPGSSARSVFGPGSFGSDHFNTHTVRDAPGSGSTGPRSEEARRFFGRPNRRSPATTSCTNSEVSTGGLFGPRTSVDTSESGIQRPDRTIRIEEPDSADGSLSDDTNFPFSRLRALRIQPSLSRSSNRSTAPEVSYSTELDEEFNQAYARAGPNAIKRDHIIQLIQCQDAVDVSNPENHRAPAQFSGSVLEPLWWTYTNFFLPCTNEQTNLDAARQFVEILVKSCRNPSYITVQIPLVWHYEVDDRPVFDSRGLNNLFEILSLRNGAHLVKVALIFRLETGTENFVILHHDQRVPDALDKPLKESLSGVIDVYEKFLCGHYRMQHLFSEAEHKQHLLDVGKILVNLPRGDSLFQRSAEENNRLVIGKLVGIARESWKSRSKEVLGYVKWQLLEANDIDLVQRFKDADVRRIVPRLPNFNAPPTLKELEEEEPSPI